MDPNKPTAHAAHGRWVKCATPIEGAHTAPDGKSVGIYQRLPHPTDVRVDGGALLPALPEHVVFVKPNGENLMVIVQEGGQDRMVPVRCDPADLAGLEACEVPGDLPNCPRNAHLFAAQG